MQLNLTSSMTSSLDTLIGKGLLLLLANTDIVFAYSVIHMDKGVASVSPDFSDVIAVCQDPEKFMLMLYTNVTSTEPN